MSNTLVAFEPVIAFVTAGSTPIYAEAAVPVPTMHQAGGIRWTIHSSAAVTLSVVITPPGGAPLVGTIDSVTLVAGGFASYVMDIPRGATWDLQVSGPATVSIYPGLILGAAA